MAKLLTLCADDYGQSAAINGGILQLLARARLNAVSCLVNGALWADAGAAAELTALPAVVRGDVSLGLHLNLTEGRPLSPALADHWPQLPTLPRLVALAHLRLLPLAALADELAAQLQAFERAAGRPPQHIDGHQHVHHLPQVRQLLLAWLDAHPDIGVRHTGRVRGRGFAIKRWLIEGTGGRRLGRQLVQRGAQANTQLLGVYDFAATDYRRLMQHWLAALPARGGLIFCHPGLAASQSGDAIAAARVRELAYLDSDAFSADLAAAGVRLSAQKSSGG